MKICEQCSVHVEAQGDACPTCRATLTTAAALLDGRYAVRGELGRGGMGVVYLARDLGLRRDVAVKVVAPKYAKDPSVVQRFRREAEVLASLRNEHVVQVYAFGGTSQPFFVMEYVRGSALDQLLAAHTRMGMMIPVRRTLTIVRQVASALDAIHAAGTLHRDVKPDNIVIEERSGRPVLIDFGLVGRLDPTFETKHVGYGTPHYMAPELGPCGELVGSPRANASADVYSLACTTYELLTGRPPFEGESDDVIFLMQAREPLRPASLTRPELGKADTVFVRALAKRPRERYTSAGDFALDLERALGPQRGASVAPPREAARSPVLRRPPGAARVLVVDDDDDFRLFAARAARLACRHISAVVQAVGSGAQALLQFERELPDVVLLDYSMPGLNGIDTLTRMRDMPGGDAVRVVVISANVSADERRRFAVLGVTDFVEKPVGLKPLVALITDIGTESGWLRAVAEVPGGMARSG